MTASIDSQQPVGSSSAAAQMAAASMPAAAVSRVTEEPESITWTVLRDRLVAKTKDTTLSTEERRAFYKSLGDVYFGIPKVDGVSILDQPQVDYGKALELWTQAAELGDVVAMYRLGFLYREGRVSGNAADPADIDYGQAIALFTKAAEKGNADAMGNLGFLYASGRVSGNAPDPAKVDLKESFYWYRQYGLQKKTDAIARITALTNIPDPLKAYHLLCLETPNFMSPGELDQITDETKLKLIIEGLCQYEDNRLTPQDQRFAMLKTILDKDEQYFDHMMTLMPVQEKDQFQNHLMRAGEEQLRYKVMSSIIGAIPAQAHGLVPELKTGSVHQKMRTEDYVIMIANLRVEMAEKARAQILSREADDGVVTIPQQLATRIQNGIAERVLSQCLESIQGVLLQNPADEGLLAAHLVFTNKLAALLEPKADPIAGTKRPLEEGGESASAAADDSGPPASKAGRLG